MRMFLGIALGDEAKQALQRLMLRLRMPDDGMRWSLPEQWHLTLVFLGEVTPETRRRLTRALEKIRAGAVELQIHGLGVFERPGIVYAAVELTEALTYLQQVTESAARTCGFAVEERPYRAHITLARRRNRALSHTFQRLRAMLEAQRFQMSWRAEEFLLYESQPTPSGSRYVVQERFVLREE